MLPNLTEYHRPTQVAEALALLNRPGIHTVPLAGGTMLVGSSDPAVQAVVDLQGLRLRYYEVNETELRLGAMTTLQQLAAKVQSADFPQRFLANAAQVSAHRIHRNMATIGGTVATADPNDALLLSLIALDAMVIVQQLNANTQQISVEEYVTDSQQNLRGGLITSIIVPIPTDNTCGYGLARVGRTLHDHPIVNAVALIQPGDKPTKHRASVIVGGVGPYPYCWSTSQLSDHFSAIDETLATEFTIPPSVTVPDDFRGTAAYRRSMAIIAARRALAAAWEDALEHRTED